MAFLMVVSTLCIAIPHAAFSQSRTLHGVVLDQNSKPLTGATVQIHGTNTGVITDAQGRFSLQVSGAVKLRVSFLGYETVDTSITSVETSRTITLMEDTSEIDEVIVVGYGAQKRANLTGSVAAINSDQLVVTKNSNVQNMLTGKLPGVRVIQKTSEPGQYNNQFDIRGFGSPLVIIDGVARSNFERLDPNEIESVSVLKDASASIYGVKSSNGVVLITTKKGQAGTAQIEYQMYYGIQKPADQFYPVGSYDNMTLKNEQGIRTAPATYITPRYSDEQLANAKSGVIPTYNWYDAVLRNTAPQHQHNINVRGGSEAVNYFINFGYYNQRGFFKSDDMNYDRYNLRSKVSAKISKRLTATLRLNGIFDKRDRQQMDAYLVYSRLWRAEPYTPFYANDNPSYLMRMPVTGVENTIASTNSDISGYKIDQRKIFQSTAELNYEVPYITGLTAKGSFSFDNVWNDNTNYIKSYNVYTYDKASSNYIAQKWNATQRITRSYNNAETAMWNVALNYRKTIFENHNVDALLLYEETHSNGDNFSARRDLNLPLPYLFAGNADGTQLAEGGIPSESAMKSLVGRLNYDYAGKYLIEASFRYDGSSRFLPSQQWDIFPAVSLGWRVSEEPFIKDNLSFIENLKFRGSYGKLGSDSDNLYEYSGGYTYPYTPEGTNNREQGYPKGYIFDGKMVPGLGPRATPNPFITWQKIYMINLGFDMDMWKGLLGVSLDLFERTRDGLLNTRLATLPTTFGSAMPRENLDSDLTRGLEVELRHRNRIGQVGYSISGNVAITRTMRKNVTRTPEGNSYANWRNNTNNRYNDVWFGWGQEGRYTSYEQIATYPVFTGIATMPGDFIYEDWNGDGVIDANDRYPIATSINPNSNLQDMRNYPLMNFGLSTHVNYKGFDLDLMFQGSALSHVSYGEQLGQPLMWDGNALDYFMDRWRPADPHQDPRNPNIEWISGYYAYGSRVADYNSEFQIQNGAYLRLKTIELGYTLPQDVLKRTGIKGIRIFTSIYNAFTITNVRGLDPERPTELYGYMYPLNRTFNFGGSIKF